MKPHQYRTEIIITGHADTYMIDDTYTDTYQRTDPHGWCRGLSSREANLKFESRKGLSHRCPVSQALTVTWWCGTILKPNNNSNNNNSQTRILALISISFPFSLDPRWLHFPLIFIFFVILGFVTGNVCRIIIKYLKLIMMLRMMLFDRTIYA